MATHQKRHIQNNFKKKASYSLLFKDEKKNQDYANVIGTSGGKTVNVKIISNNTEGLARPPNNLMKELLKGIREKATMYVLVEKNPAPQSHKQDCYSIVQLYTDEQVKILQKSGAFVKPIEVIKEEEKEAFTFDSNKSKDDEIVIDDDFISNI